MAQLDRPSKAGRDALKDHGIDPDRYQVFLDQLPMEGRRLLVSLLEAGKPGMMEIHPDAPASLTLAFLTSRMTPAEREQWLSDRPDEEPPSGRRRRRSPSRG